MATRFLHILLAISVFFSTTGLVVFQHYCKEELKKLNAQVAQEADSPHESASCQLFSETCCCAIAKAHQQPNCCDTKTAYIDSEVELQGIFENSSAAKVLDFTANFAQPSLPESSKILLQEIPFLNYQSPFLVCDLPVWVQSFRC